MSDRPEVPVEDRRAVEARLGRPAQAWFRVVVRRPTGEPVVIENEPHLEDGTPLPTLYWLVDQPLVEAVSRVEAAGGVHRFEQLVPASDLVATHERYAARREARVRRLDAPRPSGGVGGTRTGVKCLHAHLANFLAGDEDPVGALVAEAVRATALRRLAVAGEPVAVIDCGSNSTRLLVTDGEGRALVRDMRITRLAAGVDAAGRLAADARERTMRVLAQYRERLRAAGASQGLVVATSAVRDAANAEQFIREASSATGLPVRVLDGREEAAFSYQGAVAGLAPGGRPPLVVDVGGGSTELALTWEGELHLASLQLGCVRVTERVTGTGVLDKVTRRAARRLVDDTLHAELTDPAWAAAAGRVQVVGLAGTAATLAQLQAGQRDYRREDVHHQRVGTADVAVWLERLASETPAQRLGHAGMAPGREDVLVAGLVVLHAILEHFGAPDVLTSEDDILDGVAAWLRSGASARPDLAR